MNSAMSIIQEIFPAHKQIRTFRSRRIVLRRSLWWSPSPEKTRANASPDLPNNFSRLDICDSENLVSCHGRVGEIIEVQYFLQGFRFAILAINQRQIVKI